MEILKEKDMKLLSRKRVFIMVENVGATPARQDYIKEIAKKYKVKEELVVIKHMYPQYGKKKTKLIVHIYDDAKKMALFEHENLLKKHKAPEEKPKEKAEAPAAPESALVEEAPKEEPVAAAEKAPVEAPVEEEKAEEEKEGPTAEEKSE